MTSAARLPALSRWIMPTVFLGGWLGLIAARQVALFPPAPTRPDDGLSLPLLVVAVAVAAALRLARPSTVTHVVLLVAVTGAIALAAAQLGEPLANATTDYCGDQCRGAIIGRFLAFFGWPIVTTVCLFVLARAEAQSGREGAGERASWTRAWAALTLIAGIVASVAWWRAILPNG